MDTPLLQTKLYVPLPRPALVARPRLLGRLDEGLGQGRRLTLISAPAGYGKTTLLVAWCATVARPVAWLSLDEGDDDPVRFLAYLTGALKRLPHFAASPQLPDPGAAHETYLTVLLDRLGRLPTSSVLVLDDFHLISAPVVHHSVAFFLNHLPPTLHLVIATRADPPLPIAGLRAKGALLELRQADLRFSHEEATAFLKGTMGLALSAGDAAALVERTEGWVAGLQMAAVSMRQRDDLSCFVRAFAGSHRYVMDYFLEEVLQRQLPDVQVFLLHTAILEQLSAPLCAAVSPQFSRAAAQAILETLEQDNLFITPLDDRRTWYRYHRLFADLLQRELALRFPELVPALHRRASRWYETQALFSASIAHALTAGDFDRAVTLIARVLDPLLLRGELATLRKWLDLLPERVLDQHPRLCACYTWLLLMGGEPLRLIESRIAAVQQHPAGDSGQLQVVRALLALFQGDIDHGAALVERACSVLTAEDRFWYSMAHWLSRILQLDQDGQQSPAMEVWGQTQFEGQNVLLAVVGLCELGELRMKQGRLREAEDLFNRALARASDAQNARLPIAGEPLVWLGELARERNALALSGRYLTEGIERIRQWSRIAALDGYVSLARLRQAQGDADAARAVLDEAARLAAAFDATEMDDDMVAMGRARIAALQGDFETVHRWAAARGLETLDPGDLRLDATVALHLRKYELCVLGLAWILEGRHREALAFLEPLYSWVAARERWGLGIEVLALQAAAHYALGALPPALARIERALARAEPEGYVRLFVEIGDPLARLLYEAAQRQIHPEYAGRLLAAFPAPSAPATAPPDPNLIEPLSPRELDVLRGIAQGLSNREIAQRLFISERTVKWHAGNIYGKLQVSNRTEAVAKAQSLGILDR
ncbi:MAG: helix-turn-helix transcriptional regulator [Anaerolineae bacterium]|nr:helix-turn-helix transcriptional regulator [Anaerolineae bacterium]